MEKKGKLKLEKTLLVNWLYYDDELIEYGDDSTLITGGTGCGKSALADAVMLVQLGKTIGFMNKAGNENNDRSLQAYVVGNYTGGDKRKDKTFSSCVFNQWKDTGSGKRLLLGIVTDYNPRKATVLEKSWFVVRNYALPENHFLTKDRVMRSISEVKEFITTDLRSQGMRSEDNLECPRTNFEYCRRKRFAMGDLADDRYFQILEKAYTFRSSDVNYLTGFIGKFLFPDYLQRKEDQLDQEKQNLASLEMKEAQYEDILVLKAKLETVISDQKKAKSAKAEADAASYDETEARMLEAKENESAARAKIAEGKAEIEKADAEISLVESQQDTLHEQKDEYTRKMASDDATRKKQLIYERTRIVKEIEDRRATSKHGEESLQNLGSALLSGSRTLEEAGKDCPLNLDAFRKTASLLLAAGSYDTLDGKLVDGEVDGFWTALGSENGKLQNEKKVLAEAIQTSKEEVKKLEAGLKRYPQSLVDFLTVIRPFAPEAEILSDAIDFVQEGDATEWRNSVERALGDQRFAVLVDDAHFAKAVEAYQLFLEGHSEGAVGYHLPFAVVDADLVKDTPVDPSTLASLVTGTNVPALKYAVSILSSYTKRKEIALPLPEKEGTTMEGISSSAVSVGTLQKIEDCYIGRQALRLQLEAAKRRLEEAESSMDVLARLLSLFLTARNILAFYHHGDVSNWLVSYKQKYGLEELDHQQAELKEEIDSIFVPDYTAEIKDIDGKLSGLQSRNNELQHLKGVIDGQNKIFSDNRMKAETEMKGKGELLKTLTCDSVLATEMKKSAKGSFSDQALFFQKKNIRSMADAVSFKRSFEKSYQDYRETCDQHHYHRPAGEDELEEVCENYNKQCGMLELQKDAVQKSRNSIVQLFCSTMGQVIHDVDKTIASLNKRLSDDRYSFGGERYRFEVKFNTDKLNYQRLFEDFRSANDGGPLFWNSCCERYKTELGTIESHLKEEKQDKGMHYLNPMEYLTADIKIISDSGRTGYLSASSGKKSGGESQTPIYLSLMALVAESCDSKTDISRPGLIVLDEAFSKAQGDFSRTLLALMKQQGLQLVMISPDTTVANYAGRVDEQYVVTKSDDSQGEPVSHCIRYDSGLVEES